MGESIAMGVKDIIAVRISLVRSLQCRVEHYRAAKFLVDIKWNMYCTLELTY
jgi:hypothetical protein